MAQHNEAREAGPTSTDTHVIDAANPGARSAVVRCRVTMADATLSAIAANDLKKGDVLATARFAGVQAVKQAAQLLPATRSARVEGVRIDFTAGDGYLDVEARVDTDEHVGVAIEAFSAATTAALTVYDMCKAIDRTMVIGDVALWAESAGPHVTWRRSTNDEAE